MILGIAVLIIGVAIVVCECVADCVTSKYKNQKNCCCDTCPYRKECEGCECA